MAADEASEKAGAAAAVAALRAAVEEIKVLHSQDASEDTIREAKLRVAAAIKAATAAGVSQQELLEATKPPEEPSQEGDDEVVKVGDQVEIFGLTSEGGSKLNGKRGLAQSFVEDKGRFQIELGPDSVVSVKPTNLRKIRETKPSSTEEPPEAKPEAKPEEDPARPLAAGDRVEVFGLESESGSKLNGRSGTIVEHLADKDRFKVQLTAEEIVSIKPANLRRCPAPQPQPQEGESGRRSASPSSSSSSSSAGRKRKKASKVPEGLSPEETLQRLLEGKSAKPSRKSARKSDFGDAPPAPPAPPTMDPAEMARQMGAAAAAAAATINARLNERLDPGARVEVFGLMSEAGRPLNGKSGFVTKYAEESGRYQVDLGTGKVHSFKRENLRETSAAGFVEGGYGGSTAGYTLL